MANPISSNSQAAGILGMFGRVRSDISAYRARRARYNQVYNELNTLSDRDLDDLNISRGDIARIASEAS